MSVKNNDNIPSGKIGSHPGYDRTNERIRHQIRKSRRAIKVALAKIAATHKEQ